MQPTSFAGDFPQPEQRVGQIGVRSLFGKYSHPPVVEFRAF
jgi:hypothetical protein